MARSGVGMYSSTALISARIEFSPISGIAAVHRGQSRALDDRDVVARVVVGRQQLADFHLDQLQQLFVIHLVDLVQVDDHVGDADLAAQQDVLARLRHRAVGGVHDQDRAVHLGGTGDHVLDVVGVAGAVDVRVVARFGLVFHMRGRDRDPARLLFRRAVDLVIGAEFAEILRDRRRQRRLAVVNVADRPDVDVRFLPFKLCLCHEGLLDTAGHGETAPILTCAAIYKGAGEKSRARGGALPLIMRRNRRTLGAFCGRAAATVLAAGSEESSA